MRLHAALGLSRLELKSSNGEHRGLSSFEHVPQAANTLGGALVYLLGIISQSPDTVALGTLPRETDDTSFSGQACRKLRYSNRALILASSTRLCV